MPTIAKYTHGYFPSEQTHIPHIWPSLSHITTIHCINNLVLAAFAFTNNKGDSSIPTSYRTYIIELYMNEPTPFNLYKSYTLQTGNGKLNDIARNSIKPPQNNLNPQETKTIKSKQSLKRKRQD